MNAGAWAHQRPGQPQVADMAMTAAIELQVEKLEHECLLGGDPTLADVQKYHRRRKWYRDHVIGTSSPARLPTQRQTATEAAQPLPHETLLGGDPTLTDTLAYARRRKWYRDRAAGERVCSSRLGAHTGTTVARPVDAETETEMPAKGTATDPCRYVSPVREAPGRFRALGLLMVCTWFGLATWFSAAAVLPQLIELYGVEASTASL